MIYFDHASTNQVNPEVLDCFILENERFGNPNSIHALGLRALNDLEKARQSIKKDFNLTNHKVIFTYSSTMAINLAIRGYALKYRQRGKHIISNKIEHPAVIETLKSLEKIGYEITYLDVDYQGNISLENFKQMLRPDTILVAIMAINNELGTIYPIKEIAEIIQAYPKCSFFVDATQAIGKIKLDYNHIDMFAFSGHKINGLKGSGALIYRQNISFEPLIYGGGQEEGYLSGTVATANDIALAKAVNLALKNLDKKICYVSSLMSLFRSELNKRSDDFIINSPENASPFIINFSSLKKKAAVIVEALSNEGIYLSSVSACHSKKESFSNVIYLTKKDERLARNTLRVSFDETNTEEEIIYFFQKLDEIMEKLR